MNLETSNFKLFKFFLKDSKTWNQKDYIVPFFPNKLLNLKKTNH
jgi:hypothetical protein